MIGKKVKKLKKVSRDIGIDVTPPSKKCEDKNCPFHGKLSVRGQIFEGLVLSDKMDKSVIVKRDRLRYIPKYERYEKRTSKYPAHNPPCINARAGDKVRIMECRPLSKTISFVVIERMK
ncbi:MAG: 30S ribosomal protein S17 [Candidatus Thermoplasmatota archaeon]